MKTTNQGASKVSHTQQRRRGAAIATLLGGTALAVFVVGQQKAPSTQTVAATNGAMTFPHVRVVTPASPTTTDAPGAAGLRAYIDPTTGQLREPEQEELREAAAQAEGGMAFARTAGSDKQSVRGAAGGQGVALGVEYDANLVASAGPDGTLNYGHAKGATRAARAVAAGISAREVRNDR